MSTAPLLANSVVSATTQIPASSAAAASSTTSGTLAGNFQTFLTLLTTQLQNQNPLDPLDTNQFTQQLVQFAGVEQQLKSNEQLSTLVSLQQTTQATQALAFVGKNALVDGSSATLANGTASWTLNAAKSANVSVSVASANGQTVFTGTYHIEAGEGQSFNWDGRGTDGTQWPPGQYKLTTTGKDTAGNAIPVTTQVKGVVSSVDLTSTPPLLTIGGQSYTVAQVKGIVN